MTSPYKNQAEDKFKNRRRMAWVSMYVLLGFVLGMSYRLFIVGDDPAGWTAIAGMTIGALAGIVLGYTGAASYEHTRQRNDEDLPGN